MECSSSVTPRRGLEGPITHTGSIGARKDGSVFGWLPTIDTDTRATRVPTQHGRLVQRNATHRGTGLFFHSFLALTAAAPGCKGKPGFHGLLKLFVIVRFVGIRTPERQRLIKQCLVDV